VGRMRAGDCRIDRISMTGWTDRDASAGWLPPGMARGLLFQGHGTDRQDGPYPLTLLACTGPRTT
jgi:hypothetical protein